jgi:hypothetical protein
MLPIHENVLSLSWITEYWFREINPLRTSAEIIQELLSAFWRGELALVGGNERQVIYPEIFLKCIALKRDHPGFTLVDNPEVIPPKMMERLDGGVVIDLQTYIILPSDLTTHQSDTCLLTTRTRM